MNKNLVFLDSNHIDEKLFTTSKVLAECGEVQHHAVKQLIQTYEEELKEFGVLAFEMHKPNNRRGRPEKIYKLNEEQGTLLITYMKNTKPVSEFKKALVKRFFKMRKELEKG